MTWFKVDDQYWSHPKVMFISLAARGLWTTAGAYSAQHLTDGLIPANVLHTITPGTPVAVERLAHELVTTGLWEVVPGIGWRFHDWEDHQPTRAQVEARRTAEKQKKATQRARGLGVIHTMSPRVSPRDTPRESPR
jgi:hypothetical protein